MSNDPVIPRSLLTAGGLADVVTAVRLGGDGLDNKLTKASLADGQVMVVRESKEPMPSPVTDAVLAQPWSADLRTVRRQRFGNRH